MEKFKSGLLDVSTSDDLGDSTFPLDYMISLLSSPINSEQFVETMQIIIKLASVRSYSHAVEILFILPH